MARNINSKRKVLILKDNDFTEYILASRGQKIHSVWAVNPGPISPLGFRQVKTAWW